MAGGMAGWWYSWTQLLPETAMDKIPTYFSHSYRLEDQELNQKFWQRFSKADFSFFVDPPSDTTMHTHLERMMGRCSAFVAVVNQRLDVSRYFCSRFILYEYGLSIQARRPRLLLIDRRVPRGPFRALADDEMHLFSEHETDAERQELDRKILKLRQLSEGFPNRRYKARGTIALILPPEGQDCAYAGRDLIKRIERAADFVGFGISICRIPSEHNALFALELDDYEAVILDVRGKDLPEWVFAYVYGRLIPTIKLAHVLPGELPASVLLPSLVLGLRMDEREPGVESVTYWRDEDDLVWQLLSVFSKLNEDQAAFKDGRHGDVYFESIGRRPARVFISNAGATNPLAQELAGELRLRNIEYFHYKDPGAIPTGTPWAAKLRSEVESCDVFVALIGTTYEASKWSMEELSIALARRPHVEFLPYKIEETKVDFVGEAQVTALPLDRDKAVELVLREIQERLRQQKQGDNRKPSRTTLLGASRESIIDAIRHVAQEQWHTLLARMRHRGADLTQLDDDAGPVRPRATAEKLFLASETAKGEDALEKDGLVALIEVLCEVVLPQYAETLKQIATQIADGSRYDRG
jgi:hypothetical protein